MSKTTKTRPLQVRMHDVLDRKVGLVEVHHHENSDCTLPAPGQEPTGRCRYAFAYRGVNICGCQSCTAQQWRREQRRRDRHRARIALRQVLVGAAEAA